MNYITCPHCGETYPDFDAAHVCSSGPYAVKLPSDANSNMNERIKQLAEQAGLEFDDDEALEFGKQIYYVTKEDMEKFAELIVRECIDAAEEAQADFYIVHNIKSRFGVEE